MRHEKRTREREKVETQGLITAIELLMSVRETLPYRGRGFMILDSACWHLSERFWSEQMKVRNAYRRRRAHA